MSNAIQFLETLGRSPALTLRSPSGYAAAISTLEIDNAQRQALLDQDHDALGDLLGGRPKMMLQLWAPSEEAPQEDEPLVEQPDDGEGEDQGDDSPDR